MKALRSLSLAATVVTLLAAVQGRLVRVTGASLSCPDWPLCNSQLLPTTDLLVFFEWLHRLLVLSAGLLALAIVVVAWRRGGRLRAYTLATLGLVLATATLGALSVVRQVHPAVIVADEALALLFFASLVALTVWCHLAEAGGSSVGRPGPTS